MSTCCCPIGIYTSNTDLDSYITNQLKTEKEYGLLRIPNVCQSLGINTENLSEVRYVLAKEVPFKLECCNSPLKCCGTCTKRCKIRCVQDVLYRFWSMLQGNPNNTYTIAARGLLSRDRVTYEQLRILVEDQLCIKTHAKLKEYSKNFNKAEGFMDNPYRYSYEPKRIRDSNGTVTDPLTGEIQLYNWPKTGLCPYCLPDRMIIKHRTYKDRS